MKLSCYVFTFIVLLLITMICLPHSIVFIHIGDVLPKHIGYAIKQAQLFNECPIYLIANKKAIKKFDTLLMNINTVFIEDLKRSPEHKLFLHDSKLNSRWREGFWLYASERFFYLHEFMIQYDQNHVFHLENDVLLYVNLETMLDVFKKRYLGIAVTCYNDEFCIPGFIYFSGPKSAKLLIDYWSESPNKSANDMKIIGSFNTSSNNSIIDNLPVIPPTYINFHKLKSVNNHITNNPYKYFNYFEDFNSIFDSGALGPYLGGIDPRNGASKPGWIQPKSLYNPSFFTYKWELDNEGRNIPYLIFNNEKIKINTLHIHSKNLKKFLSRNT